MDKNLEEIQKIFVSYCSYGEPLNMYKLKGSMFLKLLRDAGMVRPISKEDRGRAQIRHKRAYLMTAVDADLVFKRITTAKESVAPAALGSLSMS